MHYVNSVTYNGIVFSMKYINQSWMSLVRDSTHFWRYAGMFFWVYDGRAFVILYRRQ